MCLAGGFALNCVASGRLLREGPFDDIWIQPAAGDAGGALGVALFIWHQLLKNPRKASKHDRQSGSLLGPRFRDPEIRTFLDSVGARYDHYENEDELCGEVVQLMTEEKVVGWMQGRMEFGPRALGCRSILGNPRSRQMQSVMNRKIKFRESFRPFAPSVLQERAVEYFELDGKTSSPYMLLVADVRATKRIPLNDTDASREGIAKLKVCRSEMPAVTHVDYSARVQTVDPQRHGRYYKLLKCFEHKTGCPAVINTSFNVRGEPIVCTPEHAYRCFMATNMDVLVIENFLLVKEEQADAQEHDIDEYLAEFQLD